MRQGRRIIGIEVEMAIGIQNSKNVFWINPAGKTVSRFVGLGAGTVGGFENGARFYQDTGEHPEYATPECASVREVTLYDKALEKEMAYLAARYNRTADELPPHCRLIVLKNNTDIAGRVTWGCHENYCVRAEAFQSILAVSSPASVLFRQHLATRTIFSGAGGILPDDYSFALSPRALHFSRVSSSNTTSDDQRGMINSRDEPMMWPIVEGKAYKRLHVIVGNANMSEWSTYLKVGTTHLVLKAIERLREEKKTDYAWKQLVPFYVSLEACADPRWLKEIARHADCNRVYSLGEGVNLSPCNIQRIILDMVENVLGEELTPEEQTIKGWWDAILTHIEYNDHDFLSQYLDWAIKLCLITTWLEKKNISPDILFGRKVWLSLKQRKQLSGLFMLDQLYHDVSEVGYYNKLVGKGRVRTFLRSDAILTARRMPPFTRARWRGMSIKYARRQAARGKDAHIGFGCDWNVMECRIKSRTHPDEEKVSFINNNPWDPDWSAVKKFIDEN